MLDAQVKEGIHPIVGMPMKTDSADEVALFAVSLFPLQAAGVWTVPSFASMPHNRTEKFLSGVGRPFIRIEAVCLSACCDNQSWWQW